MGAILIPIIVFGVIGLLVGLLLGLASKLFAVDEDPRVGQIIEQLPGANCGGCGYAGCSALAAAIAEGKASIDACPGNSQECIKKIAEIMGVQAVEKEPMMAFIRCGGTFDKANYKYYFDGTKTCKSIAQLHGGDKLCAYACLGYGDCVAKCNFGALSIKDGIAAVDKDKCTGCGVCAAECPKNVIELMPRRTMYYVACSSKDKGSAMKDTCSAGCIGCKICEKNCPSGAVSIVDNLASIDWSLCTGCGICAEKCPKKIILKVDR